MAKRIDVRMDEGAVFVILRENDGTYVRLLVPVDGRSTFVTPKVPLAREHHVGLAETVPYTAVMDGMRVDVHAGESRGNGDFMVVADGLEARGRRLALHQGLWTF